MKQRSAARVSLYPWAQKRGRIWRKTRPEMTVCLNQDEKTELTELY